MPNASRFRTHVQCARPARKEELMPHRSILVLLSVAATVTLVVPGTLPAKPADRSADLSFSNPVISKYGKVVSLPDATQQPRPNSRIVVDVIRGGDPTKLNGAIEKVCRYVNIYGGAGREAQQVSIAVVLHGDATLTVLNDGAYEQKFGVARNPNLSCLQELRKANVTIYVCGQSLVGKDARPDQVVEEAQVAVSALTALVNLQHDGYAYIPLGK